MPSTRLVTTILSLFVAVTLRAEPVAPCGKSIAELRANLLPDAADGKLDELSLFQAALVAGGVPSQLDLQRHTIHLDRMADELAEELKGVTDARSKLDLLLRRLHERVLTGQYQSGCSELHRTLDEGNYNCVTATLLFQTLGEHCGLKVSAIGARSHVLGCVPSTPSLYVETTCREWRSAEIGGCPPQTQAVVRDSRELSPTQLLGKVYYNLGVARLEAAQFAEATELLAGAVLLDPLDSAARENLLAAYNNWSLAECDQQQFNAAQELLLHGMQIDPGYGPLLANDLHIHQSWVRQLCDQGDFATAIEVLEQAFRRRPQAELFDRGRAAVCQLWAEHHFLRGELKAGWDVLSLFGRYGHSQGNMFEIAVIQAVCDELIELQQSSVAAQLLQQASERYPEAQSLLQSKSDLLRARL